MDSTPHSLADIEAQIRRLSDERDTLKRKRQGLRAEELKILADAYARKLQAAGFTIKEGLAALKPYAGVALGGEAPAAPRAPAPAAAERPSPSQELQTHASRVLGEDGSRWLRRAHPLLGGQTPLHVAAMPGGQEKVHSLLAAYARGA
ncbi:MAG: DUF2384 domain-containing protein [Xenophilus sp.]